MTQKCLEGSRLIELSQQGTISRSTSALNAFDESLKPPNVFLEPSPSTMDFQSWAYGLLFSSDEQVKHPVVSGWALIVQGCIMGLICLNITADIIQTDEHTMEHLGSWGGLAFSTIDVVSFVVFAAEYFLRLWACVQDDRYADAFWGRIDFATSVLTLLDLANLVGFVLCASDTSLNLSFMRSMRMLRMFSLFHFERHTKSMLRLSRVFDVKRDDLFVTFFLSVVLMLMCSLLMYVLESSNDSGDFETVFEALYATVPAMLGGGFSGVDIQSLGGQILSLIVPFIGAGLLAMPTAILGSGLIEMLELARTEEKADSAPLDFTSQLERIKALSDSGFLDAEETAAAKRKVLNLER